MSWEQIEGGDVVQIRETYPGVDVRGCFVLVTGVDGDELRGEIIQPGVTGAAIRRRVVAKREHVVYVGAARWEVQGQAEPADATPLSTGEHESQAAPA